jgi:Ca2+-binding RTX toxin-like protein
MARHTYSGIGPTIQASNVPGALQDRLLYVSATEFGVLNPDGTTTYFTGTGFIYNLATNQFTGGTVTAISHYAVNGWTLDNMASLSLNMTTITGLLTGTVSWTTLYDGNDIIDARVRLGNSVVDDVIHAGNGNDTVYGGTGNDTLKGGQGNDILNGDDGNDVLIGDDLNNSGTDTLNGGNGNDTLWGGASNDILNGGAGTDTATFLGSMSELAIVKTSAGFTVTSRQGVDTLTGIERIATDDGTFQRNAATDTWTKISDVTGASSLFASSDIFQGTTGNDNITFNSIISAKKLIQAGAGDDTITFNSGSHGDVLVLGGNGNDTISVVTNPGNLPNPTFSAQGNFTLNGGDGNDTLLAGVGADILNGGTGNDILNGGTNNDTLTGGAGADTFSFNTIIEFRGKYADLYYTGSGADVITDFAVGTDHLSFNGFSSYTVTDTAAGLLVTAFYVPTGGNLPPAPATATSTVLLEGVHGNYAIGDLLI